MKVHVCAPPAEDTGESQGSMRVGMSWVLFGSPLYPCDCTVGALPRLQPSTPAEMLRSQCRLDTPASPRGQWSGQTAPQACCALECPAILIPRNRRWVNLTQRRSRLVGDVRRTREVWLQFTLVQSEPSWCQADLTATEFLCIFFHGPMQRLVKISQGSKITQHRAFFKEHEFQTVAAKVKGGSEEGCVCEEAHAGVSPVP